MGFYRYLLAVLVLVSHTRLAPAHVSIGVTAVVSFFILSGYVMTLLVDRHYAALEKAPLFYLDRMGRIFPQYLLYLALTVVLVARQLIVPVGAGSGCGAGEIALNIAVLPLNWSRMVSPDCFYLPQAWSLALELTFYLIVPFLIASRRLMRALACLSFAVFVASVATVIDPDIYGYRTLPGTLFMFVAGMALARRELMPRWFPPAVWLAGLGFLAMLLIESGLHEANVSRDVVIGFVLGFPAVAALRRLAPSRLDEMFGNLSYGLFLNHVLVLDVLEQVMGVRIDSPARLLVLIVAATFAALVTFYAVEKPVLTLRRSLRAGAATRVSAAPAVQG